MGVVYTARDRAVGGTVAVKVLHGHLLDPAGEASRRFRREAEAARAICSDHAVRVLDAGTDEATGYHYLVTERLDGEDLQRLLDRTGPLAPGAAIAVACQALAGLAAAHEARVVHRDVKPANLFLARSASGEVTVKVLDFGIAKVRPDPLASTAVGATTTAGGLLGSPLYMSPEQVQGDRAIDHRTDLWSLGCVLYAALAGQAPHQPREHVGAILFAICSAPPPPLAVVAPWVPPEVAAAVHGALSIRPHERYASAADMLAALRPLADPGALTEAALVPSGERPRPVPPSSLPPTPAPPSVAVVGGTLSSDREAGRSEVPAVGARARARVVIVDPRPLLGPQSELWELSLDVHRHLSSLVARIWRSLRRAGAQLPPMTYGTAWALVEARTGRTIPEPKGDGADRVSLAETGIRAGTVLWVVRPPGSRP
jgi:serine/threonine-protein kinase